MSFDPSAPISADDGIFGLPYSRQESAIVLLPVPWDVTTSYKAGTHKGPEAIRKASEQLDLFDLELGHAYENGYFMESSSEELLSLNHKTRPQAELVMAEHLKASPDKELIKKLTSEVNDACETMNRWVYENAQQVLSEGKVPGVVGGDHSTPFGNMQAVSEATTEYGVLHIDAHCDLRVAYQGFEYSHASIMYNLLKLDNAPKSLVQIGIRDFCEEEYNVTQEDPRIHTFYDLPLAESLSKGQTWDASVIEQDNSDNVYFQDSQNFMIEAGVTYYTGSSQARKRRKDRIKILQQDIDDLHYQIDQTDNQLLRVEYFKQIEEKQRELNRLRR